MAGLPHAMGISPFFIRDYLPNDKPPKNIELFSDSVRAAYNSLFIILLVFFYLIIFQFNRLFTISVYLSLLITEIIVLKLMFAYSSS